MSINLKKGSKINLSKDCNASKLNLLDVGLGWDTRTDLDSFAFLINNKNQIVDTICYSNKSKKGVSLNGDNLTGAGDGDDEIISVNLNAVPHSITRIKFGANIFAAGLKLFGVKHFSQVKGAYIRLVNKENNQELCRYNLSEDGGKFNAFLFADLYRESDGTWNFEAVGQGANGLISAIAEQL